MFSRCKSKKSDSTSLNPPTLAPNNSHLPVTQSHPDLEAKINRLSEQLRRMEHGSDELKRMREALDRLVREHEGDLERKGSGQKEVDPSTLGGVSKQVADGRRFE